MPSMPSHSTAVGLARFSFSDRYGSKTSFTRLLLPLPETPVISVMHPSGIGTSMFLRLFLRAPCTTMLCPLPFRRSVGTAMDNSPDRYLPVMLSGQLMTSCTVPAHTISPPCTPAPGPTSTTKSAARIVSSSCSTTISVLPTSRSLVSVAISLALSRWCSPILGSSRMYSTPVSPLPICVASLMRCASPPDSVPAERLSVR